MWGRNSSPFADASVTGAPVDTAVLSAFDACGIVDMLGRVVGVTVVDDGSVGLTGFTNVVDGASDDSLDDAAVVDVALDASEMRVAAASCGAGLPVFTRARLASTAAMSMTSAADERAVRENRLVPLFGNRYRTNPKGPVSSVATSRRSVGRMKSDTPGARTARSESARNSSCICTAEANRRYGFRAMLCRIASMRSFPVLSRNWRATS
jgi:hypothetical protein